MKQLLFRIETKKIKDTNSMSFESVEPVRLVKPLTHTLKTLGSDSNRLAGRVMFNLPNPSTAKAAGDRFSLGSPLPIVSCDHA